MNAMMINHINAVPSLDDTAQKLRFIWNFDNKYLI